jgi:hypothetical protein
MAWVIWMLRGQASVQLKVVRQRHALALVEDLEALLGGVVAGVEDETVGVDDRGGAEVLAVGPEDRARGRAGGAEDAPGGVVEPPAVMLRLEPLLRGRAR